MTKKSLSLVFVEVTAENLESVEIVDGSTRKLAVKSIVQNFFRETFMIIMNVDEIAAHGYILMCAILCSTVKVKEFKFQDCHVYPIILSWQRELLTVEARYLYPNNIPFSASRISQYIIEKIQSQPDDALSKIKNNNTEQYLTYLSCFVHLPNVTKLEFRLTFHVNRWKDIQFILQVCSNVIILLINTSLLLLSKLIDNSFLIPIFKQIKMIKY
ncbi:unnamed protein product [Rotaria sordida]|uniref:Uncharacterized protein n=1 Tax=Rotaria sordida TaxID=392033 RepID=A0A815TIW5_9BILA|nr:unnamed protein product [Rotaria sordida]CAF4182663.1 unnamed protein product [Rotaria sordida]